MFCRYHVAQLRPFPELPIVFVTMEPVAATAACRERMLSPHPFIADPERVLDQGFGLKRATLPQIVNRNVMRRSVEAARAGQSLLVPPGRDVFQLAGTFIVDR